MLFRSNSLHNSAAETVEVLVICNPFATIIEARDLVSDILPNLTAREALYLACIAFLERSLEQRCAHNSENDVKECTNH